MSTSNSDADHVMGTVQDVAQSLYDELIMSGSSLMLSEVVKAVIKATIKYAAWSGEMQHCPIGDESCKSPLLSITANTVLGVDAWAIIEPVVRAHCDLIQARRIEAGQGLGMQPTGISSGEARQIYDDALLVLEKKSFQCEPFSVETIPDDNRVTSIWQRFPIGDI